MNCPKCTIQDLVHNSEYWASTDQLWMEFEAEVIDGWLETVYYCKRCEYNEQKKYDPQRIHDCIRGEEE